MSVRLSGISSGMDTDSLVQALMSAQNAKKDKLTGKKQKLEWKQEIWKSLNTKIYDFYKGSLNKIKTQGSFKTKGATSSDISKVTVTASSTAAEGTYKVKVNSLASAQYVTSGKLNKVVKEDGSLVNADTGTKLKDLRDAAGNQTLTVGTQIQIAGSKGTTTFLVEDDTTISDFLESVKSVGLNASFDKTQQRFFISSSTSGAEEQFKITANSLNNTQLDAISDWRDKIGYQYLSSSEKSAVSKIFDNLQAGITTFDDEVKTSLSKYIQSAQEKAVKSFYEQKKADDSRNGYESSFYELEVDGSIKKDTNGHDIVSAAGKQELLDSGVIASQDALDAYTAEDLEKAMADYVTKKVTEDVNAYKASADYETDVATGITSGITGLPDVPDFLSKSALDREADIFTAAEQFHGIMSTVVSNGAALKSMGLSNVDGSAVTEGSDASGMVVKEASDASIELNGATLTSASSNISVNGLTINAIDITGGQEVTISVTKDTSAVYDMVKDFINEYNSILTTMTGYYNAASARNYSVLTDDQKEAMSEDEIEKWNNKIKDSLLRRDDTLNSLINSFRSDMTSTAIVASNGKKYSLAQLGITTGTDYKEYGLLHIKGDEDDSEYADSENILEEMIANEPDIVMEVIAGVATKLYSDLQDKMKGSTMSSSLTFYNDKVMKNDLDKYKKDITAFEKKLQTMEDRYYKQFTAMEKAMSKLNSQQSLFQ